MIANGESFRPQPGIPARAAGWRNRAQASSVSRRGRGAATLAGIAGPLRRHFAGAVLCWSQHLEVLAGTGHGPQRVVDVPLVLHLAGLFGPDGVHLLDHLIVVSAEVA